jgi:hypothetical protein
MRKTILVLLLLLSACSERPKQEASIFEAFSVITVPPSSQLLNREVGEEAIKLRFRSELSPDDVAAFYRGQLVRSPWRLVSDVKQADGTISLFAEQDGPPLWVSIRRAPGSSGSLVDLVGAKRR